MILEWYTFTPIEWWRYQILCTNIVNNHVIKIEESKNLVRILKYSYIYALYEIRKLNFQTKEDMTFTQTSLND